MKSNSMKLLSVLTTCLFLSMNSQAQSIYRKTLAEGKSWEYTYVHYDKGEGGDVIGQSVHKTSYLVHGDTVIGNKTYYCLLRRFDSQPETYYAALREEGSTVFIIYSSRQDEEVLLAYNAQVFSSSEVQNSDYTDVVDTVFVNGRYFLRHHYEPTDEWTVPMTAVEGVGFEGNGLVGGMEYARPTGFYDYEDFVACYEDGERLFSNSDFILPSWQVASVHSVGVQHNHNFHTCFDLQGRRLKGEPKRGIYIKDGKKVLVGDKR